MIPLAAKPQKAVDDGGGTAGCGHGSHAPLHSVDPGGKGVAGGVGDTGIDVPPFGKVEPPDRLLGVVKDEGGALVDRHRLCAGGGVGLLLTGVELDGLESHFVVGHGERSFAVEVVPLIIRHLGRSGNGFLGEGTKNPDVGAVIWHWNAIPYFQTALAVL